MSALSNGHDRYAQAALDRECAELASLSHGRNHAANVASFKMGGLTVAGVLDRKQVEPLLFQAAERNGSVGKHGADVMRRTIKSGLDAGERSPRSIPESPRTNGIARPAPQPAPRPQEPARPMPKLSGVPIPAMTAPGPDGKPALFEVGREEPSKFTGEVRRHCYRRDGVIVRVKAKRAEGGFLDVYRVRREDGREGWQAKRPIGFVPLPYLPPEAPNPFAPARRGEVIVWAEGEKDADVARAYGFHSFSFGSASDCPDVSELLQGHSIIIAIDNDDAGRKSLARKVEAAARAKPRMIRTVQFDDLPVGGDIADYFAIGGTAEGFLDRAETVDLAQYETEAKKPAPEAEAPKDAEPDQNRFDAAGPGELFMDPRATASQATAKRVPLKRLDVFLAEYEPLQYALEPIVRTGSLYTLTARTGAGKTAWLISVALALATGRRDALGLDVERGRVALLTFENPDDVRMRLKVSSWFLAVDVREIVDRLLILDAKVKPEEALVELEAAAREAPLRLVLIDTLAAFFDGDNINDNVQGGNFMRRLRPITRLAGRPAVVVAAHPVKNAPQDNLLPYGGGAILNEVDGNLTLWRRSEGPGGIVELHWQGKLRGLEFEPIPFRFEITTSPEVLDAKGREVSLPTMLPVVVNAADIEAREQADTDVSVALLKAMQAAPKAQQRQWADTINRPVSTVSRRLNKLKDEKLVGVALGKWSLTHKGEEELKRWA